MLHSPLFFSNRIRSGSLLTALPLVLAAIFVQPVSAELASSDEMLQVSTNWLNETVQQRGTWAGTGQPALGESHELWYESVLVGRYYDVQPRGYLVVPTLREMSPVKMYSDESNMTADQTEGPMLMIKEVLYQRMEAFKQVYGSYSATVSAAQPQFFDAAHKTEWDHLAVASKDFRPSSIMGAEASGGPLLTVSWHQGYPYNNDCPMGDGGRTVVGCVATASAQIMKFWEWPESGVGYHQYVWAGDNSCDGSTPAEAQLAYFSDEYDWANIPDNCNGGCNSAQMAALAELNYEVGVSHEMDYGRCGSGAYTARAAVIFPTFFKYKNTTHVEYRDQFTRPEWFDLIRTEIDAGRPMQYRIRSHSIVCDGYRDDGADLEFHMNYGWNDSHNAWYVLDQLYCSWVDGDVCPWDEEFLIAGIEPQHDPALEFVSASSADPAGDGDGLAEAGEDIEITVVIGNAGNNATGVTATLTTSDPYVTVAQGVVALASELTWGAQLPADNPALVTIDPLCPNPYLAELDVAISADGGFTANGSVLLLIGDQPGFEEQAEAGEGYWDHYPIIPAYTDQWHVETYRAYTGSHSWKMGGIGSSDYQSNADGCLISPPLLLPVDAKLTFQHWMAAEEDVDNMAWDAGAVYLSQNGGAWVQIEPIGGYTHEVLGTSSSSIGSGALCYSGFFDWTQAIFDLSAYSGTVQIMFRFGSDGAATEEGWYVDDIWVGNTLAGSFVDVHPSENISVTLSNVTSRGITAVDVAPTGPTPPDGVAPVPVAAPEYCDLVTSAVFAGDAVVCVDYDGAGVTGDESTVALLHHDGSVWTDVTASVDTENDRVCGLTSQFSTFLVVEQTTCCVARVGDANGSGEDEPTIGDISTIVEVKFGGGVCEEVIPCLLEADVNQSGGINPTCEDITIGDISTLVDYLFISGPEAYGPLPDCL